MLPHKMVGEFGKCFTIWIKGYWERKKFTVFFTQCIYLWLTDALDSTTKYKLTVSRHLLEHCLAPAVVHGYIESCSCIKAACPFGCSLMPFVNWPLRNTPHVHHVWSTAFNFSGSIGNKFFNLLHSLSMASFNVGVLGIRAAAMCRQQNAPKIIAFMLTRTFAARRLDYHGMTKIRYWAV